MHLIIFFTKQTICNCETIKDTKLYLSLYALLANGEELHLMIAGVVLNIFLTQSKRCWMLITSLIPPLPISKHCICITMSNNAYLASL